MTARIFRKRWWVDFRYKKKRYRVRSPINTKRGAEEYERTLIKRLMDGEDVDTSQSVEPKPREVQLCGAFLIQWLETYAKTNNKPSGYYGKKSIVRNYLKPFFGKYRLDKIGIEQIEKFKAAQIKKGLSEKTVNNHLSVLRRALTSAEEWGRITSVPRFKWLKTPPTSFDFLVAQEGERLVAATEPEHRVMVLMALRTGLRIGELLALKWEDIDLETRKVLVRRSLW